MVLSGKSKIFGNHQKELVTKEKIISFYINGKQHKCKNHFDKYNMYILFTILDFTNDLGHFIKILLISF